MANDTTPRGIKFDSGRVMATPMALASLALVPETPELLLARHLSGDWGDVDDDDKGTNDYALRYGGRIFSAYVVGRDTRDEERVWVITEADRSSTCILLPEDY